MLCSIRFTARRFHNNLLDINAAVDLIDEFDETTFAILKHNNACGVASPDLLGHGMMLWPVIRYRLSEECLYPMLPLTGDGRGINKFFELYSSRLRSWGA